MQAEHAPSPPPARPDTILLPARWQVLKGVAYDFHQPVMLGRVGVSLTSGPALAALDSVMANWMEESLPPGCPSNPAGALVHRLLHWQSALQRIVRVPLFELGGRVLSVHPGRDGVSWFELALPTYAEEASLISIRWVAELLNLLTGLPSPELPVLERRFQRLLSQLRPYKPEGVNNFHFLHAAHRLGFPVQEVVKGVFRYGQGANARWLQSSVTDATPALGLYLTGSKSRTARLLKQIGLPTPLHTLVRNEEEAVRQSVKLGYPVVIKPDDLDQGKGVQAGLLDEVGVRVAYRAARRLSKNILVEKHHAGAEYRLNVFQNQVVKFVKRTPGGVTGDGCQTIEELLEKTLQSFHYQDHFQRSGEWLLSFDQEASQLLTERGYTPSTILPMDEFVPLRRRSNLSAGGTQTLIELKDVHPDYLDLAIRAARAAHLDFCGVDLFSTNLNVSWRETDAVIIELNGRPQIGIALAPHVYHDVLASIVPCNGRIDLQLVVCETDSCLPTASQALVLLRESQCDALSCKQGLWINDQLRSSEFSNGFEAAIGALLQDDIRSAVIVMSAGEIALNGLPSDLFRKVTVIRDSQSTASSRHELSTSLKMVQIMSHNVV